MQGDACNLKGIYSGYDLIFCHDLINRLYNPIKFFEDIPKRLNIGGLLIIFSSDLDTKKELLNFEIVDFFKTSNLNNSETYITIWKKKN